MKRTGIALLAFIVVVSIGGMVWTMSTLNATGMYTAAGGGRYYYGYQSVQLTPDDACKYAGCYPSRPQTVYTNEYGTKLALCHCGFGTVGIPLIQTVRVR